MIYVSEELKQAFLSAEQKNLLLTFDDGTVIDNDDIALESMGLEQTLCDSDELRFGKISSTCFKTKIKASTKRYKNLWFNASISVGKHTIQLGRFKVYTDNMTSDRLYREIVAYDSLFWAINTDITEWYNGLTFPITQKAFRDSLFAYLGIEQEEVELPNDNITFNRTVNVENLTGLTVLQKLCEINATWGTINNLGKFKYVRMRTHEHDALYPSDDLFPSDDLYPNDIYDDRLSKASYFQGSLKYEEYDTQPITKVTIREDADDLGYSYGNNGNTYVIEDNFLLYGANDTTLQTVAKNFYDYAQYIAYTPSELKCKGIPWREVGDLLLVVADKRTLTIPILNRQLSGITALKDTYIAKGTETYGEVKNSPTEQLKKLQRRTNRLTRTLDETKSEISKVETETKEYANNVAKNAENNANNSTNEKLKSYSTTKEMNSAITQKANEINFSVDGKITETKTYAENVSTTAETNANNHTNEKLKDYSTTTQSNAYADKVAESAKNSANANTAEKLKSYSTTTEMNTAIQQKADSITLSVDKKVTETKVYADSVSANAENNAKASTDEKLKSYSTTTEMNTAIQQKADSITSAVSKTYATQTTVNNLQQQIDGAIETFTGSSVPTLKNAPANSWTTNAIKDTHIGDLYVVNSSGGNYAGFYYRFEKSGSTYQWTLLKDNEVTKALQDAKEANEKANAVADDLSTNYSTTVEMNSAIEQKADSITSTVAKSQDTWIIDIESYSIDIYGYGNPANAMAAENKGKTYLDMETGFVYQTITNGQGQIVWTIVGECQKRTDDIYSKIQQNAYGISQKVSNGEVVSEINQSADTIELKGDRIIIESEKWKVSENGSQECSDLKITGGTIDIHTYSHSAVAVYGDVYRNQIGVNGMSVSNIDWNRKTEQTSLGFYVYNDDGERVTDIAGDTHGTMHTTGSIYADLWIWTASDLIVEGEKNRLVKTKNFGKRLLCCYETPSPMFGDLGEGKIDETGKCYIFLDDIFGETIDTDCVYQVFLQPYGKGECYVTERTSSYFIVEGTENLAFGWELKAIQRDFDTMRLEEYIEVEQEETNVLSETYGYLTTLLYNPETEVIENE